jgi:hypothetical protein
LGRKSAAQIKRVDNERWALVTNQLRSDVAHFGIHALFFSFLFCIFIITLHLFAENGSGFPALVSRLWFPDCPGVRGSFLDMHVKAQSSILDGSNIYPSFSHTYKLP